ncbi:MAG: hypothetical protein AB2A00_40780 [Myxococcota bacterium]
MKSVAFLPACLLALASACADSPIPLPFGPSGPTPDAGKGKITCADDEYTVAPTLTDIQAKVFTPSCSLASCHGGNTPEADLDLTTGKSHQQLYNRVSVFQRDGGPSLVLVIPGDPDNSFLVHKLEKTTGQLQSGNCPEGGQGSECDLGRPMPYGNPPICDKQMAAIRQWIDDGANNN